jgi:nucleoside-diphosphate-sugar epimerase
MQNKGSVCLTGAAGFIGSNVSAKLIDEGYHVVGVDDLSSGHKEFLHPRVEFMLCDFTHNDVLNKINSTHFDAIVHLAANPRVSYSVEYPLSTHENNVSKSLQLIDFVRQSHSCIGTKFIFASSSSVYGGESPRPTKESDPFSPQSPYALQKMTIDSYLRLYAKFYGLDCCSLRFFNVFGPNSLAKSSPYATAVTAWLDAIMNNEPLRFDGDGSQTRDMCHVDNVAHAISLAIKHDKPLDGEAYNVACGESVSNKEILDYLLRLYPNVNINYSPWRPGDVMHTLADISKIEKDLNYTVQTRFWEGLVKTVMWYVDYYAHLDNK